MNFPLAPFIPSTGILHDLILITIYTNLYYLEVKRINTFIRFIFTDRICLIDDQDLSVFIIFDR